MRCCATVEDRDRQPYRCGEADASVTRLVEHSRAHLCRTTEQHKYSDQSPRIRRLRTGAVFELKADFESHRRIPSRCAYCVVAERGLQRGWAGTRSEGFTLRQAVNYLVAGTCNLTQ